MRATPRHAQNSRPTAGTARALWSRTCWTSHVSLLPRIHGLPSAGPAEPEDVVQHCLTLFRKEDVASLAPFLPPGAGESEGRHSVGGADVREQGSLAPLGGVLDVGARRVLPGNLLRRSQVLSSLRLGAGDVLLRTAVTASTGEEAVLRWRLLRLLRQQGDGSAERPVDEVEGEGSSGSRWLIESVQRDASSDQPLPTTPHPKSSPEAVALAQLAALQRGDVFEAASFNNWRATDPFAGRRGGRRGFSLGLHCERLRETLAEPPYAALLRHAGAQLGPAALPQRGGLLQEVWVRAAAAAAGQEGEGLVAARFVWRLSLQPNGCWMTSSITPFD